MMKSAVIITILLLSSFVASAETVYTVDCNGGGDFRTIQACFDALPSKPAEWRTVRIMPGTYREKVTLDVYKDKVVVVGCGKYPDDVYVDGMCYGGAVRSEYPRARVLYIRTKEAEELPGYVQSLYREYELAAYNHLFDEKHHPENFFSLRK